MSTTDLLLTAAGDLDVSSHDLHLIAANARVAQQVRVTLKAFLGEYDFDLGFGVDWRGRVLGVKPFDPADVQDVIQAVILSVPDVTGISRFDGSFDGTTRKLSLDVALTTTFGPAAVTGSFP